MNREKRIVDLRERLAEYKSAFLKEFDSPKPDKMARSYLLEVIIHIEAELRVLVEGS
jgi:hypothetical protein